MSRISKAGEEGTSETLIRPASKSAMDNESERMLEASEERINHRISEVGGSALKAGEALVSSCQLETGESNAQHAGETGMPASQISHGVESGPKADEGNSSDPENLINTPLRVTAATSDRINEGRSLRSSRRTGKPSAWQREAANTDCRQEEGPSGPVNTGFILDMQRKLYCWSRENPDRVYSDLFNLVWDRRSLWLAWSQICRNKGSRTPGIDGLNRRHIEASPGGVGQFIEEVHQQLRTGMYTPQAVRQKLIPKAGKPGKFRPLGIPTLKDRIVQMALKNVLEPILEADFYPTSYGFRRGRSTMDALTNIQHKLHPTHLGGISKIDYIIEGDIQGCFDNINHHLLMKRLRKRIADRKILRLVQAFLKAGIMTEGGMRHPVAGTPQGGIISPLLANIMLTGIDERYGKWSSRPGEDCRTACDRRKWDRMNGRPTFYCVRYADDFVILVEGTLEHAETEKSRLSEFLEREMGLELAQEKTLVTQAKMGFEFLGYKVIKADSLRTGKPVGKLYIPKRKLQMIRKRIKAMTARSTTGQSFRELLYKLNPIITGWRNYYKYATGAHKDFNYLDHWLWFRIHGWLRKKHRKSMSHQLRRLYEVQDDHKKWGWGQGKVLLKTFAPGPVYRFRRRGNFISNGWNDEIDGVSIYYEALRPISGYTWLGELL
ncbi:MAG TPA: group II intron reverse transcriptase/maturase [Anaerohalosphaeraceae bacterium]|nr:group II intron reverse transcriptase/maturase [Anaerohalosphaeraceae bacterium]HPD48179.1 group II intron reverse transcriptase/maturase [Anaerohalosphaeraceae bacterium]HRT24333.1 group II intron reverse transcriptase/maturase [Anaerohalosphaeraceae bacterium]